MTESLFKVENKREEIYAYYLRCSCLIVKRFSNIRENAF